MRTHALKTWPEFYGLMIGGKKTFEYRRNDRGYRVGDILNLLEWDNATREYTGRSAEFKVTLVVASGVPGLPSGYCIMQVTPC